MPRYRTFSPELSMMVSPSNTSATMPLDGSVAADANKGQSRSARATLLSAMKAGFLQNLAPLALYNMRLFLPTPPDFSRWTQGRALMGRTLVKAKASRMNRLSVPSMRSVCMPQITLLQSGF